MGKALYRKYRSKMLSEVIGQPHITDTIARALKQGNISHAYLLTGPRGTGKTSVARILAHEVNGLPYTTDDATHLDIIEIDAASNRRIDEIRDLKQRVHIAPTSAKYKVYIIDEVHMLTKEAFNALLKTLEEPPAHVIFILATTEAHKLPETIVSRTQRFNFKPIDASIVIKHLNSIAQKEKIIIEDTALELIAEHGGGSFRDSISLLDQVRHVSDKVLLKDVQNALGQAPHALLEQTLGGVSNGRIDQLASALQEARDYGVQPAQLAKQLSAAIRASLTQAEPLMPVDKLLPLLERLANVPASHDPTLSLELALYGCALKGRDIKVKAHTTNRPIAEPEAPEVIPAPVDATPHAEDISEFQEVEVVDGSEWSSIIQAVKSKHNTLYGIVRMAVPDFQGDKLVLKFTFPFHQKRLNDTKNKQLLRDIIKDTTGKLIVVEAIVDKSGSVKERPSHEVQPPTADNSLEAISNIFGSAEVLE